MSRQPESHTARRISRRVLPLIILAIAGSTLAPPSVGAGKPPGKPSTTRASTSLFARGANVLPVTSCGFELGIWGYIDIRPVNCDPPVRWDNKPGSATDIVAFLHETGTFAPLAGRTVEFQSQTLQGQGLIPFSCRATTDANGQARCRVSPSEVLLSGGNGFRASFPGDSTHLPAEAQSEFYQGGWPHQPPQP